MTGALDGIEVLDFGANLAGPFAPQMMSDLGADVIKIEEPWSDAHTMGRGSSFFGCQRGKRSLAIDLKTPEGVEVIHRLIARADVIHHNLRPGVAERLSYDYSTAKRINPRIIFCHTTGWGSTGPNATWPGWDQFGQALGGAEYHGGRVSTATRRCGTGMGSATPSTRCTRCSGCYRLCITATGRVRGSLSKRPSSTAV